MSTSDALWKKQTKSYYDLDMVSFHAEMNRIVPVIWYSCKAERGNSNVGNRQRDAADRETPRDAFAGEEMARCQTT